MTFALIKPIEKPLDTHPSLKTLDEVFANPESVATSDDFKKILQREDFLNRSWEGGGNIFHKIAKSVEMRFDWMYIIRDSIPSLSKRHLQVVDSFIRVPSVSEIVISYLYSDVVSQTFEQDSSGLTPVTLLQNRMADQAREKAQGRPSVPGYTPFNDEMKIRFIQVIRQEAFTYKKHSQFIPELSK